MDRKELLKKGALVSIGLVSLAEKKARELAKQLNRQGLNRKKGEAEAKKLLMLGKKKARAVDKIIKKEVATVLQMLDKELHKQKKKAR
ncbi:MAG TPA: hypothetical protein VJG31_03895 [Candidatus Nanoarchaeia archaeon]|nr:hypothetical protein [Candidatus Nanoarchaeia archaeon]